MATVTANETTAGDSLETLRENLNLLRSDLSGLSAAELTGSTDNTITTVTGSGAIQGEANLTFDGSTLTVTGAVTSSGLITANGNIVIANDGNIGSAGDTDAISIDSSGNVTISQNLTVSGTQTIVDTITMNAANAIVFEGATADAHETTLSIVDPTGDHTQYLINQGGYIPVLAAATTTAITSTPAELNLLDDAAANSVVNSKAVIYGSSGELAGTLSTAAQGNVTSLGTLTTLTVDNIIINGTNIGHTSDTDSIAIASNGVVTFSQAPVFPDGSIDLDDLDIDGGTDIGAGLADADLFIVDDAAGGTNRKSAASRIKTYIADVTLTTAAQTNITSLGTLTTLTVDNIIINGTNIGHTSDTDSIAIASNGVVTFSQAPVFPDGSIDLADLDIDGGTDIGAGIADSDLMIIDDGGGGTNRKVAASRFKTYIGSTSGALDDLTVGDAASTLATSAGNITIDAQGNNTDIIFKGTDATADITMLTLDGSEAGQATFNAGILLPDDGTIGSASANSAMTIDSNGIVTFVDDILIKDGGTIGSASDADAIAIAANGVVTFSQVPVLPNNTVETADIQDNAVSLAKMAGLARGKIIYGDSSGDPAALAVGSANYVLTSDGTDISWAEASGSFDPDGAVVINESSADVDFRVESNGNANMLFVDGGNDRVGIGTASPAEIFHIYSTANDQILKMESTGGNAMIDIVGNRTGNGDIGHLRWYNNGGSDHLAQLRCERESANNSGTLKVQVSNAGAMNDIMQFTYDQQIFTTQSNANTFSLVVRNSHSSQPIGQDIYFNGAAPDDNTQYFFRCRDTAGGARLYVFGDGDVQNHDNAYGSISDERIKQDVRDANSQWDDIKAVKVRNFIKKDDVRQYGDDAWEQIGVIAQELEQVSPKLIRHSNPSSADILSDSTFGTIYVVGDDIPEGKEIGDVKELTGEKVKSVQYSVLYMKAIKALQEAMTRIETVESEVAALNV